MEPLMMSLKMVANNGSLPGVMAKLSNADREN